MATFNKALGVESVYVNIITSTTITAALGADECAWISATPNIATPTSGDQIDVSVGIPLSFVPSPKYSWKYNGTVWVPNFTGATGQAPSPYFMVPPGCNIAVVMTIATGTKSVGLFGSVFKNFVN